MTHDSGGETSPSPSHRPTSPPTPTDTDTTSAVQSPTNIEGTAPAPGEDLSLAVGAATNSAKEGKEDTNVTVAAAVEEDESVPHAEQEQATRSTAEAADVGPEPSSPEGGNIPTSPDALAATSLGATPAPVRTMTPAAPSKPTAPECILAPTPGPTPGPLGETPQAKHGGLKVSPELAEFDPFETPAPAPPKKERRSDRNAAVGAVQAGPSRSSSLPSNQAHMAAQRTSRESARGGDDTPARRSGSGSNTPSGEREQEREGDRRRRENEEPVFNFAGFLKDLRTKPAEPVARYLKSFLTNFAKKPFTVNEQIKLIRDFLAFISGKMRLVEPWRSQSSAEFDNALEAMEKLVMNRLYPYTFTPQLHEGHPITTDDLERDAVFSQRVRLFGWVREKHLDVPEGEAAQGFLGFAEQELLKINHYKAPRDKMICILNCCKVIFGLIRHTQGNEGGADAFVPILILVVLRASPDSMLSNVEYIQRFRNPEKLHGEAGYYLSSLQGAIAFIETMDASSLSNITQDEFELNVEKAIQDLPESPSSPRARASIPGGEISPFATSPGEEPAQQLALPASAAAIDGTKRFFQRTGDAARDAVSRPLSAITKILEGMQQQGYDSESGDDEDGEHVVGQWQPGGARDRESDSRTSAHAAAAALPMNAHRLGSGVGQPQPPSRLLAQLGISPAQSEGVTREPTPNPTQYAQGYPSPSPAGAGYPGAGYAGTPPHGAVPPPGYVFTDENFRDERSRAMEASQAEFAREQARSANIMTLHQMFPALDEEIVEAVLYSCGEDLGLAIDRLLEM